MRRGLIVLAIVAATLTAGQAAFAAIATQLSIGYNQTTERFHGRVRSADAECIAGRVVKVYKQTASGPVLQGKTRSGDAGGWRVSVMHASGHYFAVTPRYQSMHGTCARARSQTVDIM